ncbi:MAG: hypothetical protein AAGA76_01415 [Pseudomonadota bacterium]
MSFDRQLVASVVSQARLAPSTHNTQPARWLFQNDGSIHILADTNRFLPVCDPTNRDAGLSCGAAAEGTLMALVANGYKLDITEDIWLSGETDESGNRLAGILQPVKKPDVLALNEQVETRFTWRGHFEKAEPQQCTDLETWVEQTEDVVLVNKANDIAKLAELNDAASLITMRDKAFRLELIEWMRLNKNHPDFLNDGLNFESMQMSGLEATAAGIVLGTPVFNIMDGLGLAKSIVGEKSKTLSATAIALFHRPRDESPFITGRYFYRFWLHLARLGFAAWPMAVVADHEVTAAEISRHFSIPDSHRLINALRVGIAPKKPPRARLPVAELILNRD